MNTKSKLLSNGTVTTPKGFVASGMYSGIKKNPKKYDVALIVSECPAVAAGTFTTSKVKAWPLQHNIKAIQGNLHRVIFCNSGNANCFNGLSGKKAASVSVSLLSKALKISQQEILIGSTGIIGRPLPLEKIEKAIPVLISNLSRQGGHDAAKGILTTDTHSKEVAVQFTAGGNPVTVAAMAKGAGMVYPDMNARGTKGRPRHATMLCFVTTDLAISKKMLNAALSDAVANTFNHVAIDNDQSTNDMVLVLANGAAGNQEVTDENDVFMTFRAALIEVFSSIARKMVLDGEGVQHVCKVVVSGAKKQAEANLLARTIATSMLVKTMLAGEDPNWGRLMGCVGASNVAFSKDLDIAFNGCFILKNGQAVEKNKSAIRKILKKKEYVLEINLKKGVASDYFWMTDLTKFYVWINAQYST